MLRQRMASPLGLGLMLIALFLVITAVRIELQQGLATVAKPTNWFYGLTTTAFASYVLGAFCTVRSL